MQKLFEYPLYGLTELEQAINYTFQDKNLLLLALTHTSYVNEVGDPEKVDTHNERLEFLGDAILELAVSEEIFTRFPHYREGNLTYIRSLLVSEKTLFKIGKDLGLDKFLLLGKGEEAQGGRQRPAIIADAFEAVLAAIYLDAKGSGLYNTPLDAVKEFIIIAYKDRWNESLTPRTKKDFKTLLQESTQSLYKNTPKYALLSAEGPEHSKIFTVELTLPTGVKIIESGSSKKNAEQTAARKALEVLENL